MFQIVSAAELAALADGVGIEGSLGVIYQLRDTGAKYTWNPSTRTMVGLTSDEVLAVKGMVTQSAFDASDVGSTWTRCSALMSFAASLASGSSTTVLLEVRDSVGTVSTAATIVADTTSQTLRNAFLTREAYEYRFRRSSGTGTVSITL